MSVVVNYRSNNSGGRWWLRDGDWDKLTAAGWIVHWIAQDERPPEGSYGTPDEMLGDFPDLGLRWLDARAKSAAKKFDAPDDAIAEFERVTGQDASAEGCNCCGPPHSFEYEDDEGRTHYASARVTATEIGWD